MFFFRKRSSVQSSAMCVINLRMFYFSLQLFVCDVTIGEAYVMQMCNFLKVISYKLLLHHQSNPLWLWCVSGSVTQALLHSDVIHAWLWGGQLWRSAAGRDRFSGWDGNRTHDHRRLHSQQDQGSNRMWRFSRWEEQCVEVAAWLAGSCLCSSGSNAGSQTRRPHVAREDILFAPRCFRGIFKYSTLGGYQVYSPVFKSVRPASEQVPFKRT